MFQYIYAINRLLLLSWCLQSSINLSIWRLPYKWIIVQVGTIFSCLLNKTCVVLGHILQHCCRTKSLHLPSWPEFLLFWFRLWQLTLTAGGCFHPVSSVAIGICGISVAGAVIESVVQVFLGILLNSSVGSSLFWVVGIAMSYCGDTMGHAKNRRHCWCGWLLCCCRVVITIITITITVGLCGWLLSCCRVEVVKIKLKIKVGWWIHICWWGWLLCCCGVVITIITITITVGLRSLLLFCCQVEVVTIKAGWWIHICWWGLVVDWSGTLLVFLARIPNFLGGCAV